MHMKFLKDETISKELCDAIKKYKEIYIVVAWATTGHEVFRKLLSHSNKIKKLIVGTDSHITDPRFIEYFKHKNLSLMSNTKQRSIFHPKIYFFLSDSKWLCFMGSANFSHGGMLKNSEAMVSFEGSINDKFYKDLIDTFKEYEKDCIELTDKYIEEYKTKYKQPDNKRSRANLNEDIENLDITNMEWSTFYSKIQKRCDYGHNSWMHERLELLKSCKEMIYDIKNLDDNSFKGLMGFIYQMDNPKYRYIHWHHFGFMRCTMEINQKNKNIIHEALSHIPKVGNVTKEDCQKYFSIILDIKGVGIAISTRLLALKRPDIFFCITSANSREIYQEFNFRSTTLSNYWDKVIKNLHQSKWYRETNENKNSYEKLVWEARAAMLDTILYPLQNEAY